MKLHELSPAEGSVKDRFRKGRGPGSGNGKTAGKGHKGQNARSGGGVVLPTKYQLAPDIPGPKLLIVLLATLI